MGDFIIKNRNSEKNTMSIFIEEAKDIKENLKLRGWLTKRAK